MIKRNKISLVLLWMIFAVMFLTGCEGETVLVHSSEEPETNDGQNVLTDSEETDGQETEEPENSGDETSVEEKLCVFVCGAVVNEGVYELTAGARVNDALLAAGGFSEDAAENVMNLAAYIEDGQRLYFPTKEEAADPAFDASGLLSPEQDGSGDVQTDIQRININTAGKEELMTLSGIGEAKAESILTYRTENGAFQKTEDIMNVSGIGESLYNRIKDEICVE